MHPLERHCAFQRQTTASYLAQQCPSPLPLCRLCRCDPHAALQHSQYSSKARGCRGRWACGLRGSSPRSGWRLGLQGRVLAVAADDVQALLVDPMAAARGATRMTIVGLAYPR